MTGSLPPLERVRLTFDHRQADRVPIYDLLHHDAVVRCITGQDYTEANKRDLIHRAIRQSLDLTRSLRYPVLSPYVATDGRGFTRRYERWTTWVVKRPFHDVTSLTEWAQCDIVRLQQFDARSWVAEHERIFAEQVEAVAPTVLMWTIGAESGFFSVANDCGLELFSYLWADDPTLLSEWIEARFQVGLRKIACLEQPYLSPVAFIGEDIADGNSVTYPPRLLRQEMFPRLKEVVRAFHAKGIKVVFHSDGNLMPILPDLVNCEIDGLNPIDPLGGMDLGVLKETYGDRLTLIGSIDCSHLLVFGSPSEVRERAREHINIAWRNGGFFLGSSSELFNGIPLENVLAMWDEARTTLPA